MIHTGIKGSKKSIIAAVLTVIMALAVPGFLAGCGADKQAGAENAGTVVEETADYVIVVDQAGREVTIKKDVESIAFCYRVVARFLLSLDQGDKIKGMGKTEAFLEELQPSLKDAADVGKGVADIEALAELKPDLFIHKASDSETLEAVEAIGIPALGIDVETPDDMITALKLMGLACGAGEKADKLIDWYQTSIAEAQELTEGIKDRKTAIVMGSSIGKVADPTMLQGRMLEIAGAENPADIQASELWPTAGTEMIFKWNPDYIFISGSEGSVYTAQDLYSDDAWSEMKAVKNRHIYTIPAAEDSWEFPGTVSALGVNYMMHVMYPELMSREELDESVKEFYKLSYGRSYDLESLDVKW